MSNFACNFAGEASETGVKVKRNFGLNFLRKLRIFTRSC